MFFNPVIHVLQADESCFSTRDLFNLSNRGFSVPKTLILSVEEPGPGMWGNLLRIRGEQAPWTTLNNSLNCRTARQGGWGIYESLRLPVFLLSNRDPKKERDPMRES